MTGNTVSSVLVVVVLAGAVLSALSAAYGLWLTRTWRASQRGSSRGASACYKGTVISASATAGLAVLLGYYVIAGPVVDRARGRGASSVGPNPVFGSQEPAPVAVTGATTATSLLRVQLVGGGQAVKWPGSVSARGTRRLELEVVGLDRIRFPAGTWSVCVGIPSDTLRVERAAPGWQPCGTHSHDAELDKGSITDRDPGPYDAYLYRFSVGGSPGPSDVRLPPLHMRVVRPGSHQVGTGISMGVPESVAGFRGHRGGLVVIAE
jgi:hypothetical protein